MLLISAPICDCQDIVWNLFFLWCYFLNCFCLYSNLFGSAIHLWVMPTIGYSILFSPPTAGTLTFSCLWSVSKFLTSTDINNFHEAWSHCSAYVFVQLPILELLWCMFRLQTLQGYYDCKFLLLYLAFWSSFGSYAKMFGLVWWYPAAFFAHAFALFQNTTEELTQMVWWTFAT